MGELKKSFILYSDLIHTLEKMPDDKAGLLFKHILKYVNGEEPTTDDLIVELTFEPIKQQLKRDLKAWNEEVQNKSNGGKIGNLKRWHSDIYKQFIDKKITLEQALKIADNRIASHTDSNQSDTNRYQSLPIASIAVNDNDNVNDTVNDTVNVTVNVNDTDNKINNIIKEYNALDFKNQMLLCGFEKDLVIDFLKNRKLKRLANTKTACDNIILEIEKTKKDKNYILKKIVEKGWGAFKSTWKLDENTHPVTSPPKIIMPQINEF